MKTRTYIGYDKEGNQVKGYALFNFEEYKKFMTVEDYEKIEYLQEVKWDKKTTKNEDGSYKDMSEWKYANTKKHYIHK